MREIIIALCLAISIKAEAQIITTFAGTGIIGTTGDGGGASLAKISTPHSIVRDKWGNFYFTQYESRGSVRRIDTNGIITTIAGPGSIGILGDGGPATAASFKWPDGLAFDTSGNLYIADHQNFRIRKINMTTGIISTYAGIGTMGSSGDGGFATAAQVFPANIQFDNNNNLYITDNTYHKIRKVNSAGIITTYAGTGTAGFSIDGTAATVAQVNGPAGIAIDGQGNLFFSDLNRRVRKINTAGLITTVAGNGMGTYSGDGVPATNTALCGGSLSIDINNNLYIADTNQRIRMVDAFGIIHTVVGTGIAGYTGDGVSATSVPIYNPGGMAFDICGNLIFADITNNRIRKVTYNLPPCDYLMVHEQNVQKDISVYPNPASDELYMDNVQTNTVYQLCNVVGAMVQSGDLKTGVHSISIKHLAPGMYMLALTDEKGMRTVHKIVKE